MHIVEFGAGTLRFLEQVPSQVPANGFVWIYLERETLDEEMAALQQAAQKLGGSAVLDLHLKDLGNRAHPSHYDYTSVYDLVIFRRLASEAEVRAELGPRRTRSRQRFPRSAASAPAPSDSWCSTAC